MRKNTYILPLIFIVVSSLTSILAFFVLTKKTSFHPKVFLETCGAMFESAKEYIYFNPNGIFSTIIIIATALGVCLAVIQALKFYISHKRLHRKKLNMHTLPKKLGKITDRPLFRGISISVIDEKPTAYTIGIFKPHIIVSLSLVQNASPQQLEAVLLHELYHVKKYHLLWLFMSRLISAFFFFVPLIDYLAKQLKIEFELSADSFVVSKQKTNRHLCGSLALNLQYVAGIIPHFATSPVEKRVESIFSQKVTKDKIGLTQTLLSILSISTMLGLAFTQPNQIAASFNDEIKAVCQVGETCQTKGCSGELTVNSQNFSSATSTLILQSSSLLTSYK